LGWELRDMWVLAQEQLNGVDASNLVMWGFKVVGRKIRIHALAAAGGFYHLIHEAPMPSSRFDLQNIKVAYCATLGFVQKMKATKDMLISLNNQRTKLLCSK
ncbi:23516_t:CDS:2, partial [Gigaspora rosea]